MELAVLSETLDSLVAAGPESFGDGASMVLLERELTRLTAFVVNAAAAFDVAGGYVPDGATNAATWIAVDAHLAMRDARRQLRLARALRHLPATAKAFSTGAISASHVEAIAAERNDATKEALARDEEMLVGQATELRFEQFAKLLAYWGQLADPEGSEADAEAVRARRDVFLGESFNGTFLGKITLDPVSGAIVSSELGRLSDELYELDRAKARAELGRDPLAEELCRTPAQRRADALVEMATRSRTAPPDGRRPVPLISVLVDFPTLSGRISELASGTVVTPGSLLFLLDEAEIERAVWGPGNRVEVSATTRLFSGATRRAIELRDRTCTHPYCDRPAERCQVDHIVAFAEGGPTTQENGRLACGPHNRMRNKRPWPDRPQPNENQAARPPSE